MNFSVNFKTVLFWAIAVLFSTNVWALNAPSALSAVAASTSQINLFWQDNATNETGYIIQRSLSSVSGFTEIARAAANSKSFSNTGLAASTYYYRVRSYRNRLSGSVVYSAYSNIASATVGSVVVDPPPAPLPTVGACSPVSPIALTGYDPLPALQTAKIPSGAYVGAYTVAPNDARLIWYFSNIALLGFVDKIPNEIKTYMNLYMAHLNSDFSINDVFFNVSNGIINYSSTYLHTTAPGQYADSHDSYASTFLSLAARYYQVSCDTAWLNSVVPNTGLSVLNVLKKIADKNLVGAQWPNGLIHVFQNADAYYIAYTEDNAENYRGLADFASLLISLNDNSASTYQESAGRVAAAMQNILFTNNLFSGAKALNKPGFAFYWGNATSFSAAAEPLNSPMAFYPDGVTQIFAQAYRMGLPQASYDAGWSFLNTYFPSYTTSAYDTDPWMLIGLAAGLQGNIPLAQQMQFKTVNVYKAGTAVPINNWGFYRRTDLLLQKGISY